MSQHNAQNFNVPSHYNTQMSYLFQNNNFLETYPSQKAIFSQNSSTIASTNASSEITTPDNVTREYGIMKTPDNNVLNKAIAELKKKKLLTQIELSKIESVRSDADKIMLLFYDKIDKLHKFSRHVICDQIINVTGGGIPWTHHSSCCKRNLLVFIYIKFWKKMKLLK